jgi:hypothetical protein
MTVNLFGNETCQGLDYFLRPEHLISSTIPKPNEFCLIPHRLRCEASLFIN